MTYQSEGELYDLILMRMLSRIPDTEDKRDSSPIYAFLAPIAEEFAYAYMEADTKYNEGFVDTASIDGLIKRASERGIEVKKATPSVVTASFSPSGIVEVGERFSVGDVNFTVRQITDSGEYRLGCETPGTAGNISSGRLLPVRTVNGLQSAIITGIDTYGTNDETAEDLRARYYDNLLAAPFGGNIADYREKALTVPGVGGVQVRRTWNGGGTVKLVLLDSDYKSPSSDIIAAVQNLLDPGQNGDGIGLAPIGHIVTVVGANTSAINISVTIEYETGINWDKVKIEAFKTIREYFSEVCKAWAEKGTATLRIGKIETRLSTIEGIIEATVTALGSGTSNIVYSGDTVPIPGAVNGYAM